MSERREPEMPQNEKAEQFTKMEIFPGRILEEHETHAGQPAAYFIRTEGTTDTLEKKPGSLESMMEQLFGYEALDFIAGVNTPDQMKMNAEKLLAKLNDPQQQEQIRKIFNAQQIKRKELFG